MTRKKLLTTRANDVVETALSRDVCLSEAECSIVREVVLVELMRVEREVWGKVNERMETKFETKEDLREWVRAQQQELG